MSLGLDIFFVDIRLIELFKICQIKRYMFILSKNLKILVLEKCI